MSLEPRDRWPRERAESEEATRVLPVDSRREASGPSSRWLAHPIAIVSLYGGLIASTTSALMARELPASLLAFLAIPVLFAPLSVPRWAYLTMAGTVCTAVAVASLERQSRPLLSLVMAAGMLIGMGVITEWVRREAERRARAEATRARSDAFYRAIIELGSDLVAVVDLQGNTLYRSPAHGRLLGWREDEHLLHAESGLHPDDVEPTARATSEALENPGKPIPVEGHLRHADGSWRHVEGTITNHLDDPNVGGLVIATRDVTDRREAMRALAVSEASLREAQQIAQLGSWEWLPDEDRIIWSEQAARIYGLDEGVDTIGFADLVSTYVHPDDRSRVIESVDHSLLRTNRSELDYRIVRRDGAQRWVHAIARVDDFRDGRTRGMSGTLQDITEQRLAEIELERHRSHLEELVEERTRELAGSRVALERSERLASLGTLAAGMAHQINNPVGAILLGAECALQQAEEAGESAAELAEALREITNEAVRCRRIVRSVLKFARNESAERWEGDLRDAIERAGEAVRAQAAQHGARITIEPMREQLPVAMNPIEIEQILVNLIHNAMEAGPKGVSISMSASRQEDRVRVEVIDDGRGIEPADLAHVFEPFFTTRLHEGGTGLGLSVAHGISRDHGGELEIESVPGEGTRVSLDLPLVTAADVRL